jgi:hypothetical protein
LHRSKTFVSVGENATLIEFSRRASTQVEQKNDDLGSKAFRETETGSITKSQSPARRWLVSAFIAPDIVWASNSMRAQHCMLVHDIYSVGL